MFYSNQILARKGPLGLVWIAAHMDGRLKRNQINSTDIPASVDTLLDPEVPLALRLSGQLLLGVVRIYARKVAYLQQDCDAALMKIRVALRPADNCNLPPGSQVAPVEAITLMDPAAAAAAVAERARKAKAAKAAADGKNNAAAAAAVEGWLGPVDEDGLMLGLDDIAWDQELLMGGGEGLGPGGFGLSAYEPNTRLSFGLAPSNSGLGSQDISGVFGMYSSQDGLQETFDVEDEEAAAVWDLDELEVERLRAAPSQSGRDSLGGGGLSGLMGGDTPVGGKQGGKTPAAEAGFGGSPSLSSGGAAAGADFGYGYTPGSSLGGHQESLPGDASQPDPPGPAAADRADSMDLGLDLDPAGALPDTPKAPDTAEAAAAAAAAGKGQDQGQQADPYDMGDFVGANLGHLLPPTPHMDDDEQQEEQQQQEGGAEQAADAAAAAAAAGQAGGAAAAAAAGTPTKTFQRRATRQQTKEQQQEGEGGEGQEQQAEGAAAAGAAAAAGGGDAEGGAAAGAAAAAAKSARRRCMSGLLGAKRRVVVDGGDQPAAGGGGRGAGAGRHAPTELPAADIRALLADRAPLLDMQRVHKVGKRLQQQAASTATAQGAAALAKQQLLAITAAAATAAAAGRGPAPAPAAAAAASPGRDTTAAAAAEGAGAGAAAAVLLPGVPGLGLSLSAGCAGGLGLPLELQQLFSNATAAAAPPPAAAAGAGAMDAAAAAGGGDGGADAMAPTAPLDEIGGGFGDEEEEEGLLGFGGPGGLNPGVRGATRCSLSLSLTRTPGSGGTAQHATPGTDAATANPAAAAAAAGGASAGHTPGSVPGGATGFTPGADGYTPGFTPGLAHDDGDVLRPLDDVNLAQDDVMIVDEQRMMCWEGDQEGQEGKENTPGSVAAVVAGKGPGSAAAAAAGGVSGARMVWPADAETLLEQEAADHEVQDGSFTARTRLVVRHLQHAAAAAAGGSSAAAAAGLTPSVGSKRRISAVAAGAGLTAGLTPGKLGLDAAAAAAGGDAAAAGVAAEGPVLSFDGIVRGHSRLDACRWFYEALVLSNKGLVVLQQGEAYGDIALAPNLAGMARV